MNNAVFLSHNSADKEIAREIALFLSSENISVWFDEWEIAAGDSIVSKINEGLTDCSFFIILWSKNSQKSNWVRKELESILHKAIVSGKPRLLPILLDDSSLPPLLSDIKHIEYKFGSEETRDELIKVISGQSASRNFIQAVVKKYHEVISDPQANPFGLACCPKCGGGPIKIVFCEDWKSDQAFYIADFKECAWTDIR